MEKKRIIDDLNMLEETVKAMIEEINSDWSDDGSPSRLGESRVELEMLCNETGNIEINNLYYEMDEGLDKAATALQKLLRETKNYKKIVKVS